MAAGVEGAHLGKAELCKYCNEQYYHCRQNAEHSNERPSGFLRSSNSYSRSMVLLLVQPLVMRIRHFLFTFKNGSMCVESSQ